MRIGVGINGEGKGHVTRMIALSQRLQERHELFFWAPETVAPMIAATFPDCLLMPLPLLKFVMNKERIDFFRTGIDNIDTIFQAPAAIKQISDQMKLLRIEGVLSDFEPYSSKAAKHAGIPVLQLNHPGIVLRAQTIMPDAIISKIVAGSMMGEYDESLISSFYHGDIGPILRNNIRTKEPYYGNHIIVYVKKSMEKNVLDALHHVTKREIRVFPSERFDFADSLATSAAVIATSGHQLSCESLYLKKPICSIPVEGQFEQRLNAMMIERSGRGLYAKMDHITSDMKRFFKNLDTYQEESEKPAPEGYCFHDESGKAAFLTERFFVSGGLPLAKKA
ncbi:glycosyltransferase family protein [Sediminispirochaeta bajacaliforniensis]|uniref:glycosyltransferase family protein n=1 Tax=Sediminispirochaeta bajacaliforniensis TaxID=148 RepID=UPI0003A2C612|nr:glycosyltransferase family protein [Sediminispirochaeta bajacaliforniensis]